MKRLSQVCLVLMTLLVLVSVVCSAPSRPAPARHDYVILLHGLGRTDRAMRKMEKALSEDGYQVINIRYHSTETTVSNAAEIVQQTIQSQCTNDAGRIHFVAHSLGGIVTRYCLDRYAIPGVGRVVMLSPPNKGSELIDTARKLKVLAPFIGPAGMQLGTDTNALPNQLPSPDYEVGIITGDRTWNPLYSWLVDGRDDGKVSVTNAALDGMQDFLVVHASHTFIMRDPDVIKQVKAFLSTGQFIPDQQ